MGLNLTIFYALNGLVGRSMGLDTLLAFIADGFDYVVIALAIFTVLFLYDPNPGSPYFSWKEIKHRIKGLGVIMLATAVARGVIGILKAAFQSPRPFLVLDDVNLLVEHGGYDSFPSGHAALFAAMAVALYIYNKKLGIIFGVFALIIGVSRVVVGVHYPIDVLVGFVLGGLISWAVYKLYKIIRKKGTMIPWLKRSS